VIFSYHIQDLLLTSSTIERKCGHLMKQVTRRLLPVRNDNPKIEKELLYVYNER